MKNSLIALSLTLGAAMPAMASELLLIPLADVLQMPEAAGKLDGSVKFFLKGQSTPKVEQKLFEDAANRKSNAFNKDATWACKWAALSALMGLQEKAKSVGANAVIDIVSYYKSRTVENPVTFQCYAGALMVGMAFKGTYVKLAAD
jgi:uncharacterized protein YbjQ (UPF0145 family)